MSGGLGIEKVYGSPEIPVWQGQLKDLQLVQGGFLLDKTGLATNQVIPAGTPCVYNETDRSLKVLHTGVAQANASGSATEYRVNKGSGLKVGDNLASGAAGGKSYPITAIVTTNPDYDALTVGTTIGAVTAGDLLYASTATGATASAYPAINARTYTEVIADFGGVPISAVIRGTVYARRVPNSAQIEALLKANGAYIIHSQSF